MKPFLLATLSFAVAVAGCTPPTSSKTAPPVSSTTPRHVTFLHIADSHAQLETHPE